MIRVVNAGVTTDVNVVSGLVHTRVPFVPGAVSVQLIRSGQTLIDLTGEPIEATTYNLDMNPTTGYGAYN